MEPNVSRELITHLDNLPGIAAFRDKTCIYQYTNAAYGKVHGLTHHLDIVGGTSLDLPGGAVACAALFDEQDQLVMRTGKELKILDIHPYTDGEWRIHLYTKRPWLNDAKEIAGTVGWGVDITHAYTKALSSQLAQFTGKMQNSFTLSGAESATDSVADAGADISLSPRESEVLFLILRGKTAKLAAAAMGLSFRTVEQYLDTIKLKFGVHSKGELIDAAVGRGYMHYIPVSLFSKQLSLVLSCD
jgi:DNA-binding CsgD family transcriptional regulator